MMAALGGTEAAIAQETTGGTAAQPLPPLVVEAPKPKKKKTTAAPSKKPAPAPVATAPAPQPSLSQGGTGDGGVVGYVATKTSTATKTDTPIKDIPQSITVVTKEQAKDQGSRDLNKALTYVPGVVMGQGEGHRDAPTIRGISTTADFFIDGVRDDVQYYRDLYNVERVEVLKGPNAMIFGRGGGGGVINRVTTKADGERIYEATTTYGSFDTKRVEVDAGQAVTNDFAVRINGMYEDSGSYRDFVDLERYGINPKVTFKPDDNTKVRLAYEYFSEDRTVDRGIPSDFLTGKPAKTDSSTFFGNPDESYMTFRSHLATATVEHKFDNGIQIKNHTQYGNYEKFYQNIFANSALNQTTSIGGGFPTSSFIQLGAYNQGTERESIFNQTDVTAKVDMGGGIRHTLLAGVEVGYQETSNQRHPNSGNYGSPSFPNSDRNVPFSDPTTSAGPDWSSDPGPFQRSELTTTGVYLQDQIAITKYIDVIGGIRFDRFDLDFRCNTDPTGAANRCSNGTSSVDSAAFNRVDDVWSPRAGIVFKPIEPLSLYASYSKSFLPGSGEQFASLAGGVTGSANLKPEEFVNKEIGFKWDVAPRLFFTGALFQLDRENTLVVVAPGVSEQAGKIRSEGGELALTGYITDKWEVVAGYGYQEAELVEGTKTFSGNVVTNDTTGREVALVPRHTFSLWNKYQFLPNWGAGLGLLSRSDMYSNVSNAVTLPGYARVDAALFWDINENLKAQLNVENVFDIDYYSTAHSDNNITPGSPRAFFATVTSRF
jgi:catecholate siderophore receptor